MVDSGILSKTGGNDQRRFVTFGEEYRKEGKIA